MRFPLTPISMTLDDLDLLAICSISLGISRNFADLRASNG